MKSNQLIEPSSKEVLKILGIGAVVAAAILMPGISYAMRPVMDYYSKKEREDKIRYWNKFNQPRLKQVLKRLHHQRVIEIIEEGNNPMVKLTEKGKLRILKYDLEKIFLDKPPRWDHKWRVIIYDISKEKRSLSEVFRSFLKRLEFLKLQKSVYITLYPCKDQIEFLRHYHGLSSEILYLEATNLENDIAYKAYFGLV